MFYVKHIKINTNQQYLKAKMSGTMCGLYIIYNFPS